MTLDLFASLSPESPSTEPLCEGAVVLRGFARSRDAIILEALTAVTERAPFRQMITPGGFRMSVAMTNCGDYGWVSNSEGYRYDAVDPDSAKRWPVMPEVFRALAQEAAAEAGFVGFEPDACLINRYEIGARLTLHQDRNERDFSAPIVSVSLGIPAVFLFGGLTRSAKTQRVRLVHGDIAVWGGPARLRYHGVEALESASHGLVGEVRYNLTFRKTR